MLDLSSHSESEQDDEINEKNWPEDGKVEKGEECTNECNDECPCGIEPRRWSLYE